MTTPPVEPLKLCPACDYDLRVHAPGAPCPECGEVPPEEELEVRGWMDGPTNFGVWLLIFAPQFLVALARSDWLLVLVAVGLLVGSIWGLRASAPRLFQVRFGPAGLRFRYVGEPEWLTEHWLPTDLILTKRRLGVTSLRVVDSFAPSSGPRIFSKATVLRFYLTATQERLQDLHERLNALVRHRTTSNLTRDLPRHPKDPEVIAIPVYRPHPVGPLHWLFQNTGTLVVLLLFGFVMPFDTTSIMGAILPIGLVYLAVSFAWWRYAGRISRSFREEFRFGPGGHQFATRGDPIRLKPWSRSAHIDWRPAGNEPIPGVLKVRLVRHSLLPLGDYHRLVLSRAQAKALSAQIVTWKRG